MPEVDAAATKQELDAETSKQELAYTAPAGASLAPVDVSGVSITLSASPDSAWKTLSGFLAGTTEKLTVGMYDFTSAHVLATVEKTLAGKTLKIVLDHPSKNPTADQTDETTVTDLASTLGDGLEEAWALDRMDPLAAAWVFPTAYHIKVAVRDGKTVWVSSGNWNNSNPALDLEALRPDVQTPPFAQFFAATTVTDTTRITPVLTPDAGVYVDAVRDLVDGATTTLHMQFQYIELPKTSSAASAPLESLVAAIVARQKAGVDVKIIMSEFEVAGFLEKLQTAGLDVVDSVKIQNNVHNKGIVVDGARVLVSSQNWSSSGVSTNRDAGVILDSHDAADYFDTIFEHDWANLAQKTASFD